MAARRGYLATILALPGILRFRDSAPTEADALVGLLGDLRAAAMMGLAPSHRSPGEHPPVAADHTQARLLQRLQESQRLQEHQFSSQVPLLGGLIAGFRRAWNGIATKWYVQPLVQQQSEFNAQLVRYLEGQSRDTAENIRELTTLAERLAYLERSDERSKPGD